MIGSKSGTIVRSISKIAVSFRAALDLITAVARQDGSPFLHRLYRHFSRSTDEGQVRLGSLMRSDFFHDHVAGLRNPSLHDPILSSRMFVIPPPPTLISYLLSMVALRSNAGVCKKNKP